MTLHVVSYWTCSPQLKKKYELLNRAWLLDRKDEELLHLMARVYWDGHEDPKRKRQRQLEKHQQQLIAANGGPIFTRGNLSLIIDNPPPPPKPAPKKKKKKKSPERTRSDDTRVSRKDHTRVTKKPAETYLQRTLKKYPQTKKAPVDDVGVEMWEMYEDGYDAASIALVYKCSPGHVYRKIKPFHQNDLRRK